MKKSMLLFSFISAGSLLNGSTAQEAKQTTQEVKHSVKEIYQHAATIYNSGLAARLEDCEKQGLDDKKCVALQREIIKLMIAANNTPSAKQVLTSLYNTATTVAEVTAKELIPEETTMANIKDKAKAAAEVGKETLKNVTK